MGFHVNTTGFISGDGRRRYSPHRRATSATGTLSAQTERVITDAVQRQLRGDDDDVQLTTNALVPTGVTDGLTAHSTAASAPLRARGVVGRIKAQATSKPKTNARHDDQPLKPRGIAR